MGQTFTAIAVVFIVVILGTVEGKVGLNVARTVTVYWIETYGCASRKAGYAVS